jgi:hypothetical protein
VRVAALQRISELQFRRQTHCRMKSIQYCPVGAHALPRVPIFRLPRGGDFVERPSFERGNAAEPNRLVSRPRSQTDEGEFVHGPREGSIPVGRLRVD